MVVIIRRRGDLCDTAFYRAYADDTNTFNRFYLKDITCGSIHVEPKSAETARRSTEQIRLERNHQSCGNLSTSSSDRTG